MISTSRTALSLALTVVLIVALIGSVSLSTVRPGHAAEPQGKGIAWSADIFKAHEQSVKQNKPMLVVFGAEWCGYCKKLERTTLADAEMIRYINATFIPVHVDADENAEVTEILEVEGLPCSVVLSPNADLLGRIKGYHKTDAFRQKLVAAKRLQERVQQTSDAMARPAPKK